MTNRLTHLALGVYRPLLALLVCLGGISPFTAQAQGSFADAHATVPIPSMIGRGDAGVALPSWPTAFFVNPAHLGVVNRGHYFNVVGVSTSLNGRTFDAIEFFEEDLDDAENLSDEELLEVSDRALDLFQRPASARAAALLPAYGFRSGPVGVGAAGFATLTSRIQALDTGDPYATAILFGQVDDGVAVSAGVAIAETGLSVGITGRYLRRNVVAHREIIEDFESVPVLKATTGAVDLGALYVTPVKGLTAGLAIYNALGGNLDYEEDDFFGIAEDEDPRPEDVETVTRLLEDRNDPSVRVGLAYEVAPQYLGSARNTVFVIDWASASSTGREQSALRKLRLGVETTVGPLRLQTGLGQGYPSVGAGVSVAVVHLDYALFGRQEGLAPEDGASYAHVLQLRIGR